MTNPPPEQDMTLGLTQGAIRSALFKAYGRRSRKAIEGLWRSSPFYALTLRGQHFDMLDVRPVDLWDGDVETANRLFTGHYHLGGDDVDCASTGPWTAEQPGGLNWQKDLHGFSWLRHFAAADAAGEAHPASAPTAARAHARSLIANWLGACSRYDPIIWSAEVTARRLISWSNHLSLIAEQAEPVYRAAIFGSLARQARHLARIAHKAPEGLPRLTAAIGLAHISIVLDRSSRRARNALALVEREVQNQIRPDGSHINPCPTTQLLLLADLSALTRLVMSAGIEVPEALQHALDRMGPYARLLKMGDGGPVGFHGAVMNGFGPKGSIARSMAEPYATIDDIVKATGLKSRAARYAPYGGLARAEARRTHLVVDGILPPQNNAGISAHASVGAFELSAGRHRLVMSCGPAIGQSPSWRHVARSSAAHSMAVVDDRSLMQFYAEDSHVGRMIGPVRKGGPTNVSLSRDEIDGATLIDVTHDGWRAGFGLSHRRSLYLDSTGGDLRGEDVFDGPANAEALPLTVRFHLHPSLAVSTTGGGSTVLINPPTGPGWSFKARGADTMLEDTMVFVDTGAARHAKQIVLRGSCGPSGATIKWAFRRFDPPKKPKDEDDD